MDLRDRQETIQSESSNRPFVKIWLHIPRLIFTTGS